jgi:nitrite reductase/ring-hydroxylating ferredoxin subunit
MTDLVWHRVAEVSDLDEGRVMTVTAGRTSLALTHFNGTFGALDNHCPHQGGPLGEGSIEGAYLRCPWHGYDYDPITGTPPPGFTDGPKHFPVEVRDGGVYVALPSESERARTVSDLMVETMCAWGVNHVFGMVGHSNLGFADAMRVAEARGELTFIGIRHEGAAAFAASAYGKLTGRLAACFAIAGPGSTNLLTGLYDAKVDGAPVLAISGQVPSKVRGRGAFQDLDLSAAFADVAVSTQTVHRDSDHVELMNLACKHALNGHGVAHVVLPDDVQALPAAPGARAGGPVGRIGDLRVAPSDAAMERAGRAARAIEAAGRRRRPRSPWRHRRRRRTRGAALRADPHDVQSQRDRARRSSARMRRVGAQRHTGCELAHERVRPPPRIWCLIRQPHGHRVLQADRASRCGAGRAGSLSCRDCSSAR